MDNQIAKLAKHGVFRSLLGMEVIEKGLLGSGDDRETNESLEEGFLVPDS
jgi:hypothetical protein